MTPIAAGYAQALLYASRQRDSVKKVSEELPVVAGLITEHSVYFMNPRVAGREKAALMRDVLNGRADGLVIEFLKLLTQRRHLKHLPEIARQFDKLATEELGKIIVRLRIPYKPGKDMLDKLRDHLAARGLFPVQSKSGVSFDILLDKSLIGGFVAEYGGRLLDASVKTRLSRIR